jgi:hypothetical protein|tara:strand:- start:189 stop:1013 length:825 start_codon:yes stop_codon:yes gene_type:complete
MAGLESFLDAYRSVRNKPKSRMQAYQPGDDPGKRMGEPNRAGIGIREAPNQWDQPIARAEVPNVEPTLGQRIMGGISGIGDTVRATAGEAKRNLSLSHNRARDFAKDFDPSDSQSVLEMQKRLNATGAGLAEDGQMGPKTLAALRELQRTDNLHGGLLQSQQENEAPIVAPRGQGGVSTASLADQYGGPEWGGGFESAAYGGADEPIEAEFPEQWTGTDPGVDSSQWNWGNLEEYRDDTGRVRTTPTRERRKFEKSNRKRWAGVDQKTGESIYR